MKLELVTPEQIAFDGEVEMIVLPATEGEIGVLSGHAPIISSLNEGEVRLYDNGILTKTIKISKGFAEISALKCVVLAESAIISAA